MTTIPTLLPDPPDGDAQRKLRSDGEQSRERLLLAAMRLFAEHGYAKTSTRKIAVAAGANVAAISYYFGDKAGLYQACFSSMCAHPEANIAQFEQPHFTLRQSLEGFYQQMVAPLVAGEDAEVLLRLFYREMLEPTGLWLQEVHNSIKPEHMALARVLCRHLGLNQPNDDVHRLAYAIAGLAMTMMIGHDVVAAITPHFLASPDAIRTWTRHLVGFSEAMVNAEKLKLQQGTA